MEVRQELLSYGSHTNCSTQLAIEQYMDNSISFSVGDSVSRTVVVQFRLCLYNSDDGCAFQNAVVHLGQQCCTLDDGVAPWTVIVLSKCQASSPEHVRHRPTIVSGMSSSKYLSP